MGALDDLTKKAQDFVEENKDTINDALNSEQAEDISDKVLDGVADAAKKITADEHDAKVDDVRDNIDKVDRHRALGRRSTEGGGCRSDAASAPFVVPGAGSGRGRQRKAASGSGTKRTASGPAALTRRWYSAGV